ncbi:hypothetical protein PV08_01128 [Exophiala spinifera]|uniref:BZIP domain-containing protein n=1 Tax=Exophiala spinifera TaxID=91928 RepID=A0A0D2BNT4_9EURO|nr:uncharacterized protein PV08_01128 [Exophiala spinifera]KIW20553.1 hypothetical protein PV08_01128 [Exophiala spinifera]
MANPLLSVNSSSPGFEPTHQTWDAVDFSLFESFTDYGNLSLSPAHGQPSTGPDNSQQPTSKARRRAQNRASQRAFRERKDRHVKGLEYQLETLNEKHQDLLTSYSKQADNIARLYNRITDLQDQIRKAKVTNDHGVVSQSTNSNPTPDCFDAFTFGGNPGSMFFSADEFNSDEIGQEDSLTPKASGSAGLPLFEDLLRL